jgi:predicted PurR-regulated permease PerM
MKYPLNKWIIWAIGVGLVYAGFLFLSNVILYIVLSIIVAFMGQPLVFLLSEKGIAGFKTPRAIASLISLSSLAFLFFFVLYLFLPLLSKQIQFFSSIEPLKLMAEIERKFSGFTQQLKNLGYWPTEKEWSEMINRVISLVSAKDIGSYFGSIINLGLSFLITVFSVLFISFFMLKDAGILNLIILSATPDKQVDKMKNALENCKRLLSRYFLGLLMQVLTILLVVFAGLSIVGVQNALVLGIIAGFFNLIPYIGPFIGALIGIGLGITSELALGSTIDLGFFTLKIMLVYAITQLTDNFVLQPLIFAKSVKAHPLEIFLVVLIAGTLFGVIGMIGAIPVYTILRVVAREFFPELKFVQKLTDKIHH